MIKLNKNKVNKNIRPSWKISWVPRLACTSFHADACSKEGHDYAILITEVSIKRYWHCSVWVEQNFFLHYFCNANSLAEKFWPYSRFLAFNYVLFVFKSFIVLAIFIKKNYCCYQDNQCQPRPLLKLWRIMMILPKLRVG